MLVLELLVRTFINDYSEDVCVWHLSTKNEIHATGLTSCRTVQAAKRMVQTMGKGMYSMSTVVQGEKLGQFLDTEMPSMDNLKVLYRHNV